MLDKGSRRPRTGSTVVKYKETAEYDSESSSREDEEIPNKSRTHANMVNKPSILRLDARLLRLAPMTLRPILLSFSTVSSLSLVYGLFSIFVFSGYLAGLYTRSSELVTPTEELSSLNSLPLGHLLSKVSSLHPPPLLLDPDVLFTRIDQSVFSACLWTTDDDVESIAEWAKTWTGPISLLVTTHIIPSSAEHSILISRLARIQAQTPALKTTLSVHVLHLDPATELLPNVFLNLARLLSPSPRVVLFPGNLTFAPPKTLYKTLISQQPSSSSALASTTRTRKRKPTVLTLKGHTSFPFTSLAPLVLARDDSTWCTERFFAGMSRSADWEECLWQVWLANFGDVEVKQTQGWTVLSQSDEEDEGMMENPVAVKLHRRLVAKFRSESCALAVRRFAALRDDSNSADTKKARWLKRVCRSWTSS